jgi:hypothetical protein
MSGAAADTIRGIGVEVIAIADMQQWRGEEVRRQIWTPGELKCCTAPLSSIWRCGQKGGLLTAIEIRRFPSGLPYPVLQGAAAVRQSSAYCQVASLADAYGPVGGGLCDRRGGGVRANQGRNAWTARGKRSCRAGSTAGWLWFSFSPSLPWFRPTFIPRRKWNGVPVSAGSISCSPRFSSLLCLPACVPASGTATA